MIDYFFEGNGIAKNIGKKNIFVVFQNLIQNFKAFQSDRRINCLAGKVVEGERDDLQKLNN